MERGLLQLGELTGLIDGERLLVGALCDALVQQRAGVARGDRAVVESASAEVDRLASAIERARRRRVALAGTITGDDRLPLARFEERCPMPLPAGFVRAREALRAAAQEAAWEAAIHHGVLCRAVAAGERAL